MAVDTEGILCKEDCVSNCDQILQGSEYYYVREHERIIPTEEDIERLEKRIKATLPQEYKEFLIHYGRIAFNASVIFPIESCLWQDNGELKVFFGFSSDGEIYDIRNAFDMYEGRMPVGFLPIAEDYFGNIVCLSCIGEDRGKVYFWDHEHRGITSERLDEMMADLKVIGG